MQKAKNLLFRKIGLILVLLAAMGPYLMVIAFWHHQYDAYKLFERTLKQTELTRIELKNSEFYWVEKGKEIMVNNRMFDVKKISEHNGKTIFFGLYDDEETILTQNWMQTHGKKQRENLLNCAANFFKLLVQPNKFETKVTDIYPPIKQKIWCQPPMCYLPQGFIKTLIKPPGYPC